MSLVYLSIPQQNIKIGLFNQTRERRGIDKTGIRIESLAEHFFSILATFNHPKLETAFFLNSMSKKKAIAASYFFSHHCQTKILISKYTVGLFINFITIFGVF